MIRRFSTLFFIIILLTAEVGYLSYRAGKWITHYRYSWIFLGGMNE